MGYHRDATTTLSQTPGAGNPTAEATPSQVQGVLPPGGGLARQAAGVAKAGPVVISSGPESDTAAVVDEGGTIVPQPPPTGGRPRRSGVFKLAEDFVASNSNAAFWYEVIVNQGGTAARNAAGATSDFLQGCHALAISPEARSVFLQAWDETRVQPLANRLVEKADRRDLGLGKSGSFAGGRDYGLLAHLALEDMIGAKVAEAYYGFDLTGRQLEGGLLDGGERTQHLFVGIADAAGALATGIEFSFAALELDGVGIVQRLRCFPAGTLVHTAEGLKPIERISVGDRVWAFDHPNLRWVERPVSEIFRNQNEGPMATIRVAGETLRATGGHPFWVVDGVDLAERRLPERIAAVEPGGSRPGRWVLAMDLRAGEVVLRRDGEISAEESVEVDETAETV